MKLRFKVDQAHCFRKGIDCPNSVVTVEVDPASLNPQTRNLIANHLRGIDVLLYPQDYSLERVEAKEPSLESLVSALKNL